ncbi:MAG TPA: GNAT family N-acetyltransferase [Candidatus Limnocylindrales bacterium]
MVGYTILRTPDVPRVRQLLFEYMAATQAERGRPVPATIDDLPEVLRDECANLAAAYRHPGALVVARRGDETVGCVGLQPVQPQGSTEVKRLYVRPDHRGHGVAAMLMDEAHQLAADHGFSRLVLDVMPERTHVIGFYRRLGYTEFEPDPNPWPFPMVYLQRPVR